MAWFANHYRCARCERTWRDEWSCMCDDDCPHCGARHMSPYVSEDLTEVIEQGPSGFTAFRSSDAAEHHPDYQELGRFTTLKQAKDFLAAQ